MATTSYKEFADRIDVDAWEEAIGFEPISQKDDEDIGFCLDPWGQHQHGDRTGKLAINKSKKLYNCWVCGGGTILTYTMALKDMDVDNATTWLYQFTRRVEETTERFEAEIDRLLFDSEKQDDEIPMPYFNAAVLDRWIEYSDEMLEWSSLRGISQDALRRYRVGFNPQLTMRHFTGPAAVFPHFWQERLVGWQSRWLCDYPKDIPKYVFTNDFPRERSVYGIDQLSSALPVIVCESVPTVLLLATNGYPAVATFGASVTSEQIMHLRKLQQGIIVSADNDKAGDKFERLLVEGLERYIDVRVAERVPGEGADMGDLVNEPEIVEYLVGTATIPGV